MTVSPSLRPEAEPPILCFSLSRVFRAVPTFIIYSLGGGQPPASLLAKSSFTGWPKSTSSTNFVDQLPIPSIQYPRLLQIFIQTPLLSSLDLNPADSFVIFPCRLKFKRWESSLPGPLPSASGAFSYIQRNLWPQSRWMCCNHELLAPAHHHASVTSRTQFMQHT